MTKVEEVARAIAMVQLAKLPNVDVEVEVEKHWQLYIAASIAALNVMEKKETIGLRDSLGALRDRLLSVDNPMEDIKGIWDAECEADPFLAEQYDLAEEWTKLETELRKRNAH